MNPSTPRAIRIARGILIGMLLDLFLSFLFSLGLFLLLALWLNNQGLSGVQLNDAVIDLAFTAPWLVVSALGGASISVLSGFVAANIIQYNYKNYLGIMGTALALISLNGTQDYFDFSLTLVFALLTLSAVIAGGWLHGWATTSEAPFSEQEIPTDSEPKSTDVKETAVEETKVKDKDSENKESEIKEPEDKD